MGKTFEYTNRYEATGFGYGPFGEDEFGDDGEGNDLNKKAIADALSDRLAATSPYADTFTRFIDVLATTYYDTDRTLDTLYNERFIASASGPRLAAFGKPVGVERQTGEDDDSLRARIRAARTAAASDGSTEALADTVADALQSTSFSIETAEDVGGGQARINTTSSVVADTPLSESQIESLANRAVPPTHTVTLVQDDSFVFAGGTTGAGFGVGVWDSDSE